MKKFCVAYDLIGDGRSDDYQIIKDKLLDLELDVNLNVNVDNIQQSVWLVELDDFWDCKLLKTELKQFFKKGDRLFISLIDASDKYVLINSCSSN